MDDARRRREPVEYAQVITRAARSAEMSVYNQIFLIYNGLDLEFRRDLTLPTENTDMNAFLTEMENKKEIWWALGARHRGTGYVAHVGNQRNPGGFNNRPNAPRPYGQGQYDGYRSSGGAMGTGGGAVGARPAYQNTPPPRNQFPTSYQFRNPPPQSRAYQPQQQQQRPPLPQPQQYGGYQNYQGRAQSQPPPAVPGQSSGNRPTSQPNASAGQQQRQPFRPFQNYNNQAQPWRQQGGYQQPSQPQQQRAYHGEADENKDLDQEDYNDYTEYSENEEYSEELPDDSSHGYHGHDPETHDVEGFFVQTPRSLKRSTKCKRCSEEFPSRNRLHQHLRGCRPEKKEKLEKEPTAAAFHGTPEIIYSDAPAEQSEGLGFRSWHYAVIKGLVQAVNDDGSLTPATTDMEEDDLTPDSGCTMSAADRKFLSTRVPNMTTLIKRTPQPVRIRGIGESLVLSSEYVTLELTLRGVLDGTPVIGKLRRQIHIVDDLKANMLIGSDILGPERMLIDYNKEVLVLNCCRGMEIPMQVKPLREKVNKVVRAYGVTTVPAHSSALVPIRLRGKALPEGRDFMFIPSETDRFGPGGGVLSHITDAHLCAVQVNNTTDRAVAIAKNTRLGVVQEFEEEGCYAMSSDYGHLAAGSRPRKLEPRSWLKKVFNLGVSALAASATPNSPSATGTLSNAAGTSTPAVETEIPTMGISTPIMGTPTPIPAASMKCTTPTGITIYGTEPVREQLVAVTERYPLLWQDTGRTVDIPEKE